METPVGGDRGETGVRVQYEIAGRNMEIVRIKLATPEDRVVAETGALVYRRGNVEWSMAMPGAGFIGRILRPMQRRLAGERMLLSRFEGPGEVGLTGPDLGTVMAVPLEHQDNAIVVQRGGFIAAAASVRIEAVFVQRWRVGLFGGESLVLQRLRGPGVAFMHAAGDCVAFELAAGERLDAERRSLVWCDETVDYGVGWTGGIGTALFGGTGPLLATFTGPGRVVLQTMARWRHKG